MLKKQDDEILRIAYHIESSVMSVLRAYADLISYKFTSAKVDMKMSYNTLENNLKDNHHPKLEVMVRIARGLFPGLEEDIMPGLPRKLSSHLCRNEMMARIFAAFLGNNAKRIKQVASLMSRLADGELPTLSELDVMKKAAKKDK